MEGVKLRSYKVQVRSGLGLVHYRLNFNSFALDSEVGRLVINLNFEFAHQKVAYQSEGIAVFKKCGSAVSCIKLPS